MLKSLLCLRARVYPCRNCPVCNAALAAEVRLFATRLLFQHPLQPLGNVSTWPPDLLFNRHKSTGAPSIAHLRWVGRKILPQPTLAVACSLRPTLTNCHFIFISSISSAKSHVKPPKPPKSSQPTHNKRYILYFHFEIGG